MAIIYVDSAAGGLNDGSSWTDAYVLWQSALTNATTSDVIYMDDGHQETVATAITYTATNGTLNSPIVTYVVDKADDSYSPNSTAYNIRTTGLNSITLVTSMRIYGMYVESGLRVLLSTSPCTTIFYDSYIKIYAYIMAASNNGDVNLKLRNTTLEGINSLQAILKSTYVPDFMQGGAIIGAISGNGFVVPDAGKCQVIGFEGVDMSGITTGSPKIVNATGSDSGWCVTLKDCKYPSGYSLIRTSIGTDSQCVESYTSDTGGNRYVLQLERYRGAVNEDTATYMTGGFQPEGASNPVSYTIVPNSTAGRVTEETPIDSLDISFYYNGATGSSKTFTVECVENFSTALTDQNCWSELCYLGTASSALCSFDSNKQILGSGTNLSAGTGLANWTGEPASSRSVKLVHTVTPQVKGLYRIRIFLGKYEAGKEFFYNSKVAIA